MQTMTTRRHQEAFEKLRDGEQMEGLADAARCRSESDWLIGINGTRALTKRMFGSRAGNVASVGRVQTPTLAIVYARELEIRNFKPRDYWRVTATFEVAKGKYEGVYQRPNFRTRGKRRTRSHRSRLGEGDGRGGRRRVSGPAARLGHRGKERPAPRPRPAVRSDHVAARGEQSLMAFRPDGRSRSRRRCTSGTR